MTWQPRPISPEGVTAALAKAERYRLINDPSSAESICLDILAVDAANQQALVTLLLAITDQFAETPSASAQRARELLPRLDGAYRQAYYAGIVSERLAKAQLSARTFRHGDMAYHGLRDAMAWYEKAEALRPAGNDEAILRWNSCARLLERHKELAPREDGPVDPDLE
jgi:hypothetical protein